MEKLYYVILSCGAYSDYEPEYFVGKNELTQEEFEKIGRHEGDKLLDWYETLPIRKDFQGRIDLEQVKFWPDSENESFRKEFPSFYLEDIWTEKMKSILMGMGFEKLPEYIPELNVNYSSIPNNYEEQKDSKL